MHTMTTLEVAKAVPDPVAVGPVRASTVLGCALFIGGVKAALKLFGFARTLQWVRAPTVRRQRDDAECAAIIADTQQAVATAAALFPGRAMCLEQSLTLLYYLRRAGVDAHLRLGVQPHPFGAHAWVEFGTEPVNDFVEHIGHYLPLPELPR